MEWIPVAILLAVAVLAAGVIALARRQVSANDVKAIQQRFDLVDRAQERMERATREELGRGRAESGGLARDLREEVSSAVRQLSDSMVQTVGTLSAGNERRLDALREAVETRLGLLQEENAQKLDEMRRTVDERLLGTLDSKLGQSFQLVSERLEQVHRGLGEMQSLASGVGDLKRVLSNVKTRGLWGETQLRALLEQGLAPEQYAANVPTRAGSAERVEFVIKLPGGTPSGDVVYLPVDAKFPLEDYQRLVDALERALPDEAEAAGRQIESRLKAGARDIRDKYINPPTTTDFAIMFLPTEGLYAEALRRPGLVDVIQRESRVVLAGPTTLWAIINSLQMGFRTLAIQRRSSEVWRLLGEVKSEFGRFGDMLDGIERKLYEASNKVDLARRGTRSIQRRLDDVQLAPGVEEAPRDLLGDVTAPFDVLIGDSSDEKP